MTRSISLLQRMMVVLAIVATIVYWGLILSNGQERWLIYLLIGSVIFIPFALLGSIHAPQWLLPRRKITAWWSEPRSTSTVFVAVALLVLIPTLLALARL